MFFTPHHAYNNPRYGSWNRGSNPYREPAFNSEGHDYFMDSHRPASRRAFYPGTYASADSSYESSYETRIARLRAELNAAEEEERLGALYHRRELEAQAQAEAEYFRRQHAARFERERAEQDLQQRLEHQLQANHLAHRERAAEQEARYRRSHPRPSSSPEEAWAPIISLLHGLGQSQAVGRSEANNLRSAPKSCQTARESVGHETEDLGGLLASLLSRASQPDTQSPPAPASFNKQAVWKNLLETLFEQPNKGHSLGNPTSPGTFAGPTASAPSAKVEHAQATANTPQAPNFQQMLNAFLGFQAQGSGHADHPLRDLLHPQAPVSPAKADPSGASTGPAAPDFHHMLNTFLGPQSRESGSTEHPLQNLLSAFLSPAHHSSNEPVAGPSGTSGSGSNASGPHAPNVAEREAKEMEEAIRLSLQTESVQPAEEDSGKGKEKNVPVQQDAPVAKPEDIQLSLVSLDSISSSLNDITSSFTFPLHLDFRTATPSRSSSRDSRQSYTSTTFAVDPLLAKLAWSPNNAPVRQVHEALNQLIKQVDEVPSFEREEIRLKRKAVLTGIEDKIEEIEREINGRFRSWEAKKAKELDVDSQLTAHGPEATPAVDEDTVTEAAEVDVEHPLLEEQKTSEGVPVKKDDHESDWSDIDVPTSL